MQTNTITLQFGWMVYHINRLKQIANDMTIPDENIIEEQQNKLRKSFPNKFMPNCFALGVAIMEYDGTQHKWEDFNPQELQEGLITNRIHNIADRDHDVKNTKHFHCICGQDISYDNSYFYNKGFIWMIVGKNCAEKYKLVSHVKILELRKEKRAVKRSVAKNREEECRPKCADCGIYFTGIGTLCLDENIHTWK